MHQPHRSVGRAAALTAALTLAALLTACGSGVDGSALDDDAPAGTSAADGRASSSSSDPAATGSAAESTAPGSGGSGGSGSGGAEAGSGSGGAKAGSGSGGAKAGGSGGSGGSGGGDTDEVDFGWGLPSGPSSPNNTVEDDVYLPLAAGDCAGAQDALESFWNNFHSPRTVLLYQAGIAMCRGDEGAARRWYEKAAGSGWSGVNLVSWQGFHYDCQVYRSVRSVLDEKPRKSFSCPGGELPPWPNPDPSVQRDDPRTDADESATEQKGGTESPESTPEPVDGSGSSGSSGSAETADTNGP